MSDNEAGIDWESKARELTLQVTGLTQRMGELTASYETQIIQLRSLITIMSQNSGEETPQGD